MQNLTQPTLLLKPFAESGTKNTIPNVNTDPSNPQKADLTYGFPSITSETPDNGGLPPERADFNGLGYLTTTYDYYYQAGGTFTYNATIASAIGGYPLNARLWYTDSNGVSCILRSTIANNSNNFLIDSSVIGITGSGKPWEIESFRGIGLNTQYVTNCITEIPQDIKLELSSGTLTLKSGSKVYVPNGAGVFNTVTISSDISISSWGGGSTDIMVLVVNGNSFTGEALENIYSGSTQPTVTNATALWYDTTNNVIKRTADSGSTWTQWNACLPICVFTRSSGTITGIKQTFNGFGYIGSTLFCLPNVKGIYPDGRNADGTLKGGTYTIASVLTTTFTSGTATQKIRLHAGYLGVSGLEYDSENNYNYLGTNVPANRRGDTVAGIVSYENAKITSISIREVFHATDYYDLEQVDLSAVHKTGTETVAGVKTFTNNIVLSNNNWIAVNEKRTDWIKGTAPSASGSVGYEFQDKDGKVLGQITASYNTSKDTYIRIKAYKANASTDTESDGIEIYYPATGTVRATAPVPPISNSTSLQNIATIGWVNDPSSSTNVVHRTDDETIDGTKTFSKGIKDTNGGSCLTITRGSSNFTEIRTELGSGNTRTGGFRNINDNGNTTMMYVTDSTGSTIKASINAVWDGTNAYATAPTPPSATDNSTKIATTAWVYNARGMITGWSMPNYNAGVSKTNDVNYTASSNGWLYWGVYISNNSSASLTVSGIVMTIRAGDPTGLQPLNGLMIPVSAGVAYRGTNLNVLTFYPCIGG